MEVGDEAYEVDFQRKGTYQAEEDAQAGGSSSRGRSSHAEDRRADTEEWAGGVTGEMGQCCTVVHSGRDSWLQDTELRSALQ